MIVATSDPLAGELAEAIRSGDLAALRTLLIEHPHLATCRFGSASESRSALHIATDWPGNFRNVAEVIELLVAAGADVNSRFVGSHAETPLHWAASADDVAAIDALVAAGADIEANGGVLTGGPPLDDAIVFTQLAAARRLVHHGARTALFHAAALDIPERVAALLPAATADEVTSSLWHAANTGSVASATLLLDAGANPRWLGFDDKTPLDAARLSGNATLVALLESRAA